MRYWVYMLECADGRYYVGSHRGDQPEERVAQHNAGIRPEAWTYSRRPVTLVWLQEFWRAQDAIALETQLKGWSREKKRAVIEGKWTILPDLARRRMHSAGPDAAKDVQRPLRKPANRK